MVTKQELLIAHNFLEIPSASGLSPASMQQVATVLANLAYYGFAPSTLALDALRNLSESELSAWWTSVEPAFRSVTGANRKMEAFVVYKNFPREVLEMSQAQYWFNQICIYIGAPYSWVAEQKKARPPLTDKLSLKTLQPAAVDTLTEIARELVTSKTRWMPFQQEQVEALARMLRPTVLDLADFGFKENGLTLMAKIVDLGVPLKIADATDVLRFAAVLSDGDVSLREKVVFRAFKRAERRFLLNLLENAQNLHADVAARAPDFKILLSRLRPGDYRMPRVQAAYDALFKGELKSYASRVEAALNKCDAEALALLSQRPGEFLRRLHAVYSVFGDAAVSAFLSVAPKLESAQLLKLRGYLRTINSRQSLAYAPKGNWSKLKVVPNEKAQFSIEDRSALVLGIDAVLAKRLHEQYPHGANVDESASLVKLPTNDQELASYGRGTVFPIPQNMNFLRTASYWEQPGSVTWFDNGWLFYKEGWMPSGACCWNSRHEGAVFSGDPVNTTDMKGRACQMIDLDLDALKRKGIRYAVWNILAYSHVKFADAKDVLATLQWGEKPCSGKLYEPSRAQMVFPLKGASLTKYIAYVDVVRRELVYLDANLAGEVSSAQQNLVSAIEPLKALLEHLESLPSVADVFDSALSEHPEALPVAYSDEQLKLSRGQTAFVFKPVNARNDFKNLDIKVLANV